MDSRLNLRVPSIVIGVILTFLAQQAMAGGPTPNRAVRKASGPSLSGRTSLSPRSLRIPSSGHNSWSTHRGDRSSFPNLGGSSPFGHNSPLGGLNGLNGSGLNPLDLLWGLGQLNGGGFPGMGGPQWGGPMMNQDAYYGYKADKEYADAMRDAAIANAVANVATAIIMSDQFNTPRTVVTAPPAPPAPVVVQPQGHYELRREKVGGGYYQTSQVWVPERVDSATGNVIEGHYENVRQWVPEVWQETQVWVQPVR